MAAGLPPASDRTIESLVRERNNSKILFTAGPPSLLPENLTGLRPCFGRGDPEYADVEERVLEALKRMTGHRHIARMQGSATLALEVMALNFLYGRVLVVSTGYYSDRLRRLIELAQRRLRSVREVAAVHWTQFAAVAGDHDWIVACSTETSRGLRLPIESLSRLARQHGARLMLDATASIGLESGHELADALAYSSCKGLFGLTGASFVAFNDMPIHDVDSFYLSLATHLEKRVTGPYHAIASLVDVLPKHADLRAAVEANKSRCTREMASWLTVPASHQPLLCTHVSCRITTRDPRVVLYTPRGDVNGSIICHLGEAHLGYSARGDILAQLEIDGQDRE